MPTLSEQLVSKISEKFFFPKFVYTNVYIEDEKGEPELCDIIIEFDDFYVCLEVKEKEPNSESGDSQWFENKVLKKAVGQIKKTVQIISKGEEEFYTKSENGEKVFVAIDYQKEILPVVVFYNNEYKMYNRHYFSKSINKSINIFSYDDFCVMLDAITIPFDIVGYLLERSTYMPEHGGLRFIIEDLDEEWTMHTSPQTEKDYAEMYLVKNYYNKNIQPEYLKFYNEFLSMLYADYEKRLPTLFQLMLSADAISANGIVKNYCDFLENMHDEHVVYPKLICRDKVGIMIMRRPFKMSDEPFNNVLRHLGLFCAYKYRLTKVYAIIFTCVADNSFTINEWFKDYDLPEYDEELEKLKRDMERNQLQWKRN